MTFVSDLEVEQIQRALSSAGIGTDSAAEGVENLARLYANALRETDAMRDNLTATQKRCTELLEENRRLEGGLEEIRTLIGATPAVVTVSPGAEVDGVRVLASLYRREVRELQMYRVSVEESEEQGEKLRAALYENECLKRQVDAAPYDAKGDDVVRALNGVLEDIGATVEPRTGQSVPARVKELRAEADAAREEIERLRQSLERCEWERDGAREDVARLKHMLLNSAPVAPGVREYREPTVGSLGSVPLPPLRYVAEPGCEPSYGSAGAGGIDLRVREGGPVGSNWTHFPTGLRVEIPAGHVGLVRGRSGGFFRSGIECFEGTIDADYRGEIRVSLRAIGGATSKRIPDGARVAQLVVVPCPTFRLDAVAELSETERGEKGFGSTGSE